jgi:hypothetical protein
MPALDRGFCEEAAAALGVLILALARHAPAPSAERPWVCAIFDTIQDLCKNNDRIGERRKTPGSN